MEFLIVPGWHGSGPEHWQTLWQSRLEGRRVHQDNWAAPDPDRWVERLDESIRESRRSVCLIAHSLGVLTVRRWALRYPRRLAGAFLVAPPDSSCTTCESEEIRQFECFAAGALPFPALLVGSENDPYASLASVQNLAQRWGCGFHNAGRAGHVNADSGHGEWPGGRALFSNFLRTLERDSQHDARRRQSRLTNFHASASGGEHLPRIQPAIGIE